VIGAQSAALDIPFRLDGTGRITATWDLPRQMALRLRSIIGTTPGERVMRPGYGSGAGLYVFDVNDELRSSMLASAVKNAIQSWEPAVAVEDVKVEDIDPAIGRMQLRITYRLLTTGEVQVAVVAVSPTATSGWPG
jgi:phage baseplate assembly protein W